VYVFVFFLRLTKTSISAPIGAIIYAYLIDPRRCLSIANMCYRNNRMSKDEKRSIKVDNTGGVSITTTDQSSISPVMTYFFFDQSPLWCDLLPGRYNLTCQMRLRRQVKGLFVIDLFNVQFRGELSKKKENLIKTIIFF
jgi:hypothetical protein